MADEEFSRQLRDSAEHARILWRLDALDAWRKDIDRRVAVVESDVGNLTFSDKLAQALADKLEQKRRVEFTVWQKLGAFIVGAVAVAGGLKVLIG